MDNLKERWQFIIGFAAIIISLSAFKDELKSIVLDYQFVSFSLSDYLFVLIVGFILVIHLYVIPYIFSSTKYSNRKIFKYLESLSYFIFVIIILSPSLLLIIYLIQLALIPITKLGELPKYIMSIVSALIGFLVSLLSNYLVKKYLSSKRLDEQINIQEEEVKSFENAQKLISEGFYNQAIFESFKILETSLYKMLRDRDLVFRRGNFLEMVNIARNFNILSESQIRDINEVRIRRNEIAHNLDITITKQEAENSMKLIREISAKETTEVDPTESESKYFIGKVFYDLEQAKNESKKLNKPIFIVIYDKSHPTKSKLDHSLGYFMEYETTKKLVSKNFIQTLIDSESPGAKELIPVEDPLENCLLVITTPNEQIIKREGVYANPDEGMKRVKKAIAQWNGGMGSN